MTPVLLLTPTLAGCSLLNLFSGPAAPPAPEPLPPPRAETIAETDLAAGLDPLPSSQQLLRSVPFGRTDPFAPLSVAPATTAPVTAAPAVGTAAAGTTAAGTASQAASQAAAQAQAARQALSGLQLTGVIQSGAGAEALVSHGELSGSLRTGDRGGTSPLLPAGWRVAAISLGGPGLQNPPSLTLVNAGQRLTLKL
ncbi:MAG: hypothetical protein VKJ44_06050 [Synechococcus sp.]|nr:hypothetical protein [Synechococcus sp.]